MVAKGEMGYPSVLTAKTWGFYDVLFKGKRVQVPAPVRQLRHGERAVQDQLSGGVPRADRGRMRDAAASAGRRTASTTSSKITIRTHESAIRIIDKKGPLDNPADRDHCIQYMVAVPLHLRPPDRRRLRGRRSPTDPRIDRLRDKMVCVEDKQFSQDYLDPDKRSIANAITIEFKDGGKLKEVVVEYPIGHRRRRKEGMPGADRKVQDQPRAALSGQAAASDSRARARSPRRWTRRRARVRRPVRHLIANNRPESLMKASRNLSPSPPRSLGLCAHRVRCRRRRSLPVLKSGLWEVTRNSSQQPDAQASHHDVPRRVGPGADARVQPRRCQGDVLAERPQDRRQQDDGDGHLQARPDDDEDPFGHDLQREHLVSHRRHRDTTTRRS